MIKLYFQNLKEWAALFLACSHTSLPVHGVALSYITYVGDEVCQRTGLRSMLQPDHASSRCLLHARGDWRDRVDLFCPSGEGTVQVEGDNSRFIVVDGLSPKQQQQGLDILAQHRLQLLPGLVSE